MEREDAYFSFVSNRDVFWQKASGVPAWTVTLISQILYRLFAVEFSNSTMENFQANKFTRKGTLSIVLQWLIQQNCCLGQLFCKCWYNTGPKPLLDSARSSSGLNPGVHSRLVWLTKFINGSHEFYCITVLAKCVSKT
jgi:hypothetical protein